MKEPKFEVKDGLRMLVTDEVFNYISLYDVERSIEDLFTEVENLKPIFTNLWGVGLNLERALTYIVDGELVIHFYNFGLAPDSVAWMGRGAHGKLFYEISHEKYEERHLRIALWKIIEEHKTLPKYDPENTQAPVGFVEAMKKGNSND